MTSARRFSPPPPRFTLFCAALALLCLSLSFWQHRRAQLKESLQEAAQSASLQEPVALAQLGAAQVAKLSWRNAVAVGEYAAAQLLIDNRFSGPEVGFHVIAPLQLGDGRWLLVNRGWLKAPLQRLTARAPTVPAGTVTLAGVLVPDAGDAFELGSESARDTIRQHLKIKRWQSETGKNALPLVLVAYEPASGLAAVAAVPDFKAARSYGYRLQWFALALVAIGGWFAVGLRKKKMRAKWQLILILAVALGTPIAATALFFLAPPQATTNAGEFISPTALPAGIIPPAAGGDAFWHLLSVAEASCDDECRQRLCVMHQVRLINFGDSLRVGKLWLLADDAAPPAAIEMNSACGRQLAAASLAGETVDVLQNTTIVPAAQLADALPAAADKSSQDYIYVIDPQGLAVMRYGGEVPIKSIAKDMRRLLRLSRRGG